MKRIIIFSTVAVMLVACAGRLKHATNEAPEPLSHPRIEIVYNAKSELGVLDTGATPTVGLGGPLGPVGMLVTIGIDAASRNSSLNQVASRSQRFKQAVQDSSGELTLHEEYVERLADAMRATGREVKITPRERATGAARKMELAGLTATPGYEVMLLRITAGYGAPSLTSDFRPIIVVEYALRDDKLQPITWNSATSNRGSPSYFSYDTLLKENKAAYEGLRQELFATVGRVMNNDFPKQE